MKPYCIDALIVTALQVERHAVREHLDDLDTRREGPIVVDVGRFGVDTAAIQVGIIECGPGNIDSAAFTTATVMKLQPKVVLHGGRSRWHKGRANR